MSEPILATSGRLGHVHIADNNRLQPDAGCMNLQLIFAALKQIGYKG